MMALGEWETVTSKKGSKNLKSAPKGVKKINFENAPRIRPIAPLEESPNIYHAFLEEELRKERKLLEAAEKGGNSKEGKKQNVSQPQKKKDRRMTLQESLITLDHDEIDSVLKKDEAVFPKNPEIWLKDMASLLNSKLDHIPDSDPILSDKSHDYPLCVMPDKSVEFFLKKLKGFNDQVYDALMDHCLEFIMNGISKDQSSIGYRLTIQLLLKEHPDVILKKLLKFESLIQKNSNRPLGCLCILWVVSQVGYFNFSNGIKVWFNLMFNLIEVKNLNNYVLGYLENLFERHPKRESGDNAMTKTDYFKYFGKLYSDISTLPVDIKSRLQRLYPLVKAVAWGNVSKNLNSFFIGYLSRLTNDCHEAKKMELLQCLIACLENDVQSFSHWKKDYHKYIGQSSLLLQYINNNFDKLKLNKKLFCECVSSFQLTNEKLSEKTNVGQGLKSSDIICKNILSRSSRKSASKRSFFWMITLLIAFFAVGVMCFQDSLKGSVAHQQFQKVMSDPTVKDVLQKSEATMSWLMASAVDLANNASEFANTNPHVVEYTAWIKQQSLKMSETLTEKMNEHLPTLLQHMETVTDFSLTLLSDASSKLGHAYNYSYNYVVENVLVGNLSPENIAKEVTRFTMFVQDGMTNLYSRIQEFKANSE